MSYPGSKGQDGAFQAIIGQMRPHSLYVEAFVGSGKIFDIKKPARESVVIDVNPRCLERFTLQNNLRVLLGSALEMLPSIYLPSDALVYCDPPYPLETRQGRLYYDHEPESTDPNWHTSLLTLLQALKCDVMISGVECPLYVHQLQDWRCVRYKTKWHRKVATECLWCNFPEPTELHDWRFAGRNHRQRVSLKRLAARWLAKLEAMRPLQQGYVLNAIEQRQSQRDVPAPHAGSDVGGRQRQI